MNSRIFSVKLAQKSVKRPNIMRILFQFLNDFLEEFQIWQNYGI
jgi:hypothetical protein